jgi:endonuclease YncB( thermonuclease family)
VFVVVTSDEDILDLKVFEDMSDARAFAEERVQDGYVAKVYGVPGAQNARAAKAAIEMGAGEILYAPTRKPPERDVEIRGQRNVRVRRLKQWVPRIKIEL